MKIPLSAFVSLLWEYMRTQIRWVLALATALLLGIALSLYSPRILANFVDAAESVKPLDTLIWLAILYMVVEFVKRVFGAGTSYLSTRIGWTATNSLREDLVRHTMMLDMSFHNSHTPGEMIERVDGDVGTLNEFFSLLVIQILRSGILLIGIHAIVFYENWKVGFAFLSFSVVTILVANFLRRKGEPYQYDSRKANAELYGFLEEKISGIEDISTCGASAHTLRSFAKLARSWFFRSFKAAYFGLFMMNVMDYFFVTANAVALGLGAYFYVQGEASIGFAYLLFHYSTMLREPIQQLVQEMENLMKAGASIARIQELKTAKSVVDNGQGELMPKAPLEIEFDDVSFHYHDTAPVLRNVSFKLGANRSLGLVGHTGSGKTTLSRLLFRFYDPISGTVKLNGQDIREPDLYDLRSRVSLVTQNVQLFIGSIRENLTFFDDKVSDEKIYAALDRLGLKEWMQSLPDSLDMKISPGGAGFSAGEAQLLALARILVKDDGDIVILDEPSSRLDPKTESLIQQAMQSLVREKTAIIIAHHLSTLKWVDDIMVMDAGRIIEYGEREALLKSSDSRFAELFKTSMEVKAT